MVTPIAFCRKQMDGGRMKGIMKGATDITHYPEMERTCTKTLKYILLI